MSRSLNRGNADLIGECVQALELSSEDTLLDVGFGGGGALRQASTIVTQGHLYGVDFSPDMVAQAHRSLGDLIRSGRLSVLTGDVMSLPLADGLCTKILSTNTIYFWADLPSAFARLRRVLAPGGRLVLGFSGQEKLDRYGAVTQQGFAKYSDAEVISALRDAGFDQVVVRSLHRGRTVGDYLAIAGNPGRPTP